MKMLRIGFGGFLILSWKKDAIFFNWLTDSLIHWFDWVWDLIWAWHLISDRQNKMNGGDEAAEAPPVPPQPLEWKFSQVFGERTAGEEVQEGNMLFIWIHLIFDMGFAN